VERNGIEERYLCDGECAAHFGGETMLGEASSADVDHGEECASRVLVDRRRLDIAADNATERRIVEVVVVCRLFRDDVDDGRLRDETWLGLNQAAGPGYVPSRLGDPIPNPGLFLYLPSSTQMEAMNRAT
jgi:hypothetical protein